MNPEVWQASGHVETFTDPMVDCRNCKHRFRADDLTSDVCPNCGGEGPVHRAADVQPDVEDVRRAGGGRRGAVYLRPETAQGIFVNFENVLTTMRRKLPFGIAQIGKSFRNEITPGNFIFRVREFEQMEMEYFCYPGHRERAARASGSRRGGSGTSGLA